MLRSTATKGRKNFKSQRRINTALSAPLPPSSPQVQAFAAIQTKAGIRHHNDAEAYHQLRSLMQALAPYLPAQARHLADPAVLFNQRNPKFPEGSMPLAHTDSGKLVDGLLKLALGLDARTTFKAALDGSGQTAGGLVIINKDTQELLLAVKGDPYNKGRIGVLGGQASDKDNGNTRQSALRESGEEIGSFPFQEERLIRLITTMEWRDGPDSRGTYNITSTFDLYSATTEEISQMQDSFRKHVEQTGGDPEVAGLRSINIKQALEMIRDGQMNYYDQTQAFLMTALCLKNMEKAGHAVTAAGFSNPTEAQLWQMARAISQTEFDTRTTVEGDWRKQLDVESCLATKNQPTSRWKAPTVTEKPFPQAPADKTCEDKALQIIKDFSEEPNVKKLGLMNHPNRAYLSSLIENYYLERMVHDFYRANCPSGAEILDAKKPGWEQSAHEFYNIYAGKDDAIGSGR